MSSQTDSQTETTHSETDTKSSSKQRRNPFKSKGKTIMKKVQKKFVNAYQLIKEGGDDANNMQLNDHYHKRQLHHHTNQQQHPNSSQQNQTDENSPGDFQGTLSHTDETIYINVVVKNSIQLVRHELERLAQQRWMDTHKKNQKKDTSERAIVTTTTPETVDDDHHHPIEQHQHQFIPTTFDDRDRKRHERQQEMFQKFRAAAQGHIVNLVGIALASDFTPRRIAVQLSNDLYRQLTPRLKRRGVTVATEIGYRVGPYFVLAVNVKQIDWARVVKVAHRGVNARRKKWCQELAENDEAAIAMKRKRGFVILFCLSIIRLLHMTKHEILAQFLAWMYHCPPKIYLPICAFLYRFCMGSTFRTYFLASVADDIFSYVEEKGMQMDIGVLTAPAQAGAMLCALREIRDGVDSGKKQEDDSKAAKGEGKTLLGPLLGPAIPADKDPAPSPPDGFEMPANLQFVGLDIDLPVGFRRLRWALLSTKSQFLSEAVYKAESKYENIVMGNWSVHDDYIGSTVALPDGIQESDFLGAEKTVSYLMPRSAFVKANTCTETTYIDVYNDYCFCVRKKALTPEVPYGSTFVAWTKFIVINTGNNTCKMTASVEAEFPNGEPMISRQIRGGMRQGVTEAFVTQGETITKYADEYP